MTACRWCGTNHGPRCPHVKAMEYEQLDRQMSVVRRVEFFSMEEVCHHEEGGGWPERGATPEESLRLLGLTSADIELHKMIRSARQELKQLRSVIRKISALPITPEIEEVLKPFAFMPPPAAPKGE